MISITSERGDDPKFQPGEKISGIVQWSELTEETESLEVRLIWFTIGKGDQDSQFVQANEIAVVGKSGEANFEFTAPHRPNSFAGKLIAIQWAIEVIIFPQREAEQAKLTINPPIGEIVLTPVEDDDVFWEEWSFGKKRKS